MVNKRTGLPITRGGEFCPALLSQHEVLHLSSRCLGKLVREVHGAGIGVRCVSGLDPLLEVLLDAGAALCAVVQDDKRLEHFAADLVRNRDHGTFQDIWMDALPEKVELAVRMILHELTETPDAPTFLPLPPGTIGRRIADLALADPRCQLDIDELASRAANSVRAISRLFPAETGLTYKAWRQRARIVLAIDRLATGSAISRVASQAGFARTAVVRSCRLRCLVSRVAGLRSLSVAVLADVERAGRRRATGIDHARRLGTRGRGSHARCQKKAGAAQ